MIKVRLKDQRKSILRLLLLGIIHRYVFFQNECSFNWHVNSTQPDGPIYNLSGKYVLSTNLENTFELYRAFYMLRLHACMYATDRIFLMDIYNVDSTPGYHLP